jgi:hypothetical protein
MPTLKLLFVIAALFVANLSASTRPSSAGYNCWRVERIASDPTKIAYLRRWIETSISDPEFLRFVGPSGTRFSRDVALPEDFARFKLDLEKLGTMPWIAGVRFNVDRENLPAYLDKTEQLDTTTIKSVSFDEGRDSIIIKVGDSADLGLGQFEKDAKPIAEGVWILCRN